MSVVLTQTCFSITAEDNNRGRETTSKIIQVKLLHSLAPRWTDKCVSISVLMENSAQKNVNVCVFVCVFYTLLGASGGSISLPCALGSCHLLLQWEKGRLAPGPIPDLTHSLIHHNLRATAGSSHYWPEEGDHTQYKLHCVSAELHHSLMFTHRMLWGFTCSSENLQNYLSVRVWQKALWIKGYVRVSSNVSRMIKSPRAEPETILSLKHSILFLMMLINQGLTAYF